MRRKRPWVMIAAIAVAVIQSAALLLIIERHAEVLRTGGSVLLRTRPVDPRDLMRGDYVHLGYEISTVPSDKVTGKRPAGGKAAAIYVTIRAGPDGLWHLDRAFWQQPARLQEGETMLVGRTQVPLHPRAGGRLAVEYGIERYYIPEGAGRRIEDAQRASRLVAVIAVSDDGTAQIRALRENGGPIYEEPYY